MIKRIVISIFISGLLFGPVYLGINFLLTQHSSRLIPPAYDHLALATIAAGSSAPTHQNSRYGFRFLYPPQSTLETADSIAAQNHLLQVRLSSTGPSQAISHTDWLIKVWNRIVTDTQIVEHLYSGLEIIDINPVVISGQKAREIVLRGPQSSLSGTTIYRVYIITTPYYTYTLNSEYCHQTITPKCSSLLSSFTVYKPDFNQ